MSSPVRKIGKKSELFELLAENSALSGRPVHVVSGFYEFVFCKAIKLHIPGMTEDIKTGFWFKYVDIYNKRDGYSFKEWIPYYSIRGVAIDIIEMMESEDINEEERCGLAILITLIS